MPLGMEIQVWMRRTWENSHSHIILKREGPILLVHGTRDTRVKLDQSKGFIAP